MPPPTVYVITHGLNPFFPRYMTFSSTHLMICTLILPVRPMDFYFSRRDTMYCSIYLYTQINAVLRGISYVRTAPYF